MDPFHKQLFEKGLIKEKQFSFLNSLYLNKLVSLFYEIRIVLYLGILLFTGGVSYIAYLNIGEVGHVLLMIALLIAIIACFYFLKKFVQPYSNKKVIFDHNFHDFIVLLTSLLIISLFTYFQVYFDLIESLIHVSAFSTAGLFFLMAYKFDNRAVLSLGISALAGAFGVSVSPVNWSDLEWVETSSLYTVGIILGAVFIYLGEFSTKKDIKKHFAFTYQNFGLILLFLGFLGGVFDSDLEIGYALTLIAVSCGTALVSWKRKEFLFFLYSSVAGYIALSYLMIELLDTSDGIILLVYYFPFTCIGYIVFLISKKSHFKDD